MPYYLPFKVHRESLVPSMPKKSIDELRQTMSLFKLNYVATFTVNKKKEIYKDKHGIKYNKEIFQTLTFMIDRLVRRFKGYYYMMPEIGKGNNPHYHAVLMFPSLTEEQFYNIDTYCVRNIGLLDMRKINSLTETYDEYIPARSRRGKKDTRETDFKSIYEYIHKDEGKYGLPVYKLLK